MHLMIVMVCLGVLALNARVLKFEQWIYLVVADVEENIENLMNRIEIV